MVHNLLHRLYEKHVELGCNIQWLQWYALTGEALKQRLKPETRREGDSLAGGEGGLLSPPQQPILSALRVSGFSLCMRASPVNAERMSCWGGGSKPPSPPARESGERFKLS